LKIEWSKEANLLRSQP